GLIERWWQLEPLAEGETALERQTRHIVHAESRQRLQHRVRVRRSCRTEARRAGEREACVLHTAETPQQGFALQACAPAVGTWRVAAVLRQQHADVHLVALGLEPREEAARAVPAFVVPVALAFDHPRTLSVLDIAPRDVGADSTLACVTHEIVLALVVAL